MSNDNIDPSSTLPSQDLTDSKKSKDTKNGWEHTVLEKLVFATLKEQRTQRRWGIFFKLITVLIVMFSIWQFSDLSESEAEISGKHVALINIDGAIDVHGRGAAEAVIPALNRAYENKGSVGIILHINSPGGSPVQAGMINDEMNRLRKLYPQKPVYVVVEEVCASGAYYIAAAADKIYVNKASIVGSIGVLMDGFGFTGLMNKLGVERRLLTAGENKGFMDPFSPQNAKHTAYVKGMLNEIHQQFIDVVRQGRGKRLKETPEMFSGLFWSGATAIKMGLADDFGTVDTVSRDVLKTAEMIDYTEREGLPERVLKKFGADFGSAAIQSALQGMQSVLR